MKKETIKTFVILVLVLLVVLLSIKSMKCYQKTQDKPLQLEKVYLTDTITQVIYDTLFIDHFEIVKLPVDTITIINDRIRVDSVFVEVPISIYKFDTTFTTDTTVFNLSLRNSGFNVTLDTLSYSFTYRPTKTKTNYFRDHFRFGLGIGTGYGFFTRKPDVFLGVGFYYCF